jgi:hypothetical protein
MFLRRSDTVNLRKVQLLVLMCSVLLATLFVNAESKRKEKTSLLYTSITELRPDARLVLAAIVLKMRKQKLPADIPVVFTPGTEKAFSDSFDYKGFKLGMLSVLNMKPSKENKKQMILKASIAFIDGVGRRANTVVSARFNGSGEKMRIDGCSVVTFNPPAPKSHFFVVPARDVPDNFSKQYRTHADIITFLSKKALAVPLQDSVSKEVQEYYIFLVVQERVSPGARFDIHVGKDPKAADGAKDRTADLDFKGWHVAATRVKFAPGVSEERFFKAYYTPGNTIAAAYRKPIFLQSLSSLMKGNTGGTNIPGRPETPDGPGKKPDEPDAPGQEPDVPMDKVRVRAGNRHARPDTAVTVPIWLEFPKVYSRTRDGRVNVANLNVKISYDPSVVKPAGKIIPGNLVSGAIFQANTAAAGLVKIGFASKGRVQTTGTLAQVPFQVIGQAGQKSPINVKITTVNDDKGKTPTSLAANGVIQIIQAAVLGDINGNGIVDAGDALAALKMSVDLMEEDLILNVDKKDGVTSNDARLLLQMALQGTGGASIPKEGRLIPPKKTPTPPTARDTDDNDVKSPSVKTATTADARRAYQEYIAAYNKMTSLMAKGQGDTPAAKTAYAAYKKAKDKYEAAIKNAPAPKSN